MVERTGVRPSRVIGTIEDITTQKLQQEQYKQQSQFLKNVIESLAHPFLVIDAENYDVILANSATHQKFKKCGIKCYELTHKIDRPCTDNHEICPLNKIRKIKKPVVIDHVHYDDRGNPRNMEVHAHPIFDENGEVKQIIEYTLDVTERKQAEKLLKRRLEFEKVISNISANFVITKNIYNYISKSLSSLAMIIDAQRINLFKFDKTKNIIENLQQWKKKDILPEKSPLCNVSLNKLPYLKEQIKSKPLISWTDISKLTGKGEAEKKFFQENKIESILVFPILIKGQVSGLLVIENIINPDSLKNEDTVFLKIISEIFASALERHLAENALLNSEIKYRKLYENIRDGIVNIDNRGNIIESNQAFQKMLGYSAETLQKLSIVDIIPKKWYRKERQIIENQVPQKGYSKLHELELIKKDGTVFPVEIQIYLKKTEKEAEGIWASIRDITKRKETEQRLLEMSQFRESVIQNANVWLHVTNKKDEIVLVNKAAQQISGYSKEELLNTEKIWNKLYPDEQYRKKISEVQKKKFENGEYLENFETTITCREGFEKIMLWNLRQLTDENGEALGSITIGRDITERKKAETELQRVIRELTEAKKEAEQANKFKSEFLANMSHEIRTPMNAIIGFSNILQESKLPKELQHYLIHIKNSSEHLLDLINDILDLSKIEAGRLEIEEFEFDLVEVFKKVLSILKPRAKKKKLKVKALIEEDITETFIGDATRIRQILMNLLSNAIKFTEEGRVNVTLTTDHLNRTDDILPIKITVEDTGVGIPEDRLERIFDSFERGTSSTNRAHEGTGLGLSITRKLTELMNGTIDVKSIEGEGTTFTVKIPLKVKKNSHRALPKGRSTKTREIKRYQQFKDKLILVIENDEAYRHLLEMNLKQLVNKVVGVPSAEDAQKFISFLKPDLIILDIVLPGMSGWDFLSQFRTEKGDLLIPTIVYSVVSDEQKCAEFGVKQCINKSVRIESLLPRLEKILSEMYSTKKIVLIEDEQLIINTIRTRLKDYPFELNVFNSSQQGIDFVKNNDVDFVIIDMDLSGENGVKFFSSLAELGKKDIKVFVYTGKELTQSEKNIINYYSETILYKYETSIEQLLEEVNKTKIEKPTKGLQEVNFSNETRVPEKTQKPEVKAFNQSEKEILIVEDNPVNQELIKVYLKKCPYKLTFSKNGLEAVELAQVRKFDVILMDIQLPTIDGYEATRRIRKESKNQETPIIALTAHAMKGEEEKARSAGCNSYLSKPVDKEKLIKTISSFTQIETEISLKEELLGRIDPDIVELLPHYIENVKETIRGMKKSLASQNYGSLRRKAHNLKGTGSSFGLNKISLLGEKLEIAVDRNDIEEARNLVKNLEEYYIGLSNEFSPDK
ncbi:MAG: response regulator [Vulcanimicrobiota bacterium]